jgi:hypothetical protein
MRDLFTGGTGLVLRYPFAFSLVRSSCTWQGKTRPEKNREYPGRVGREHDSCPVSGIKQGKQSSTQHRSNTLKGRSFVIKTDTRRNYYYLRW